MQTRFYNISIRVHISIYLAWHEHYAWKIMFQLRQYEDLVRRPYVYFDLGRLSVDIYWTD